MGGCAGVGRAASGATARCNHRRPIADKKKARLVGAAL